MSFFHRFRNPKFQQTITSTLFTLLFSLPFIISACLNIQYLNEKIANNTQLKGIKNSKSVIQSAITFNILFLVAILVMMMLYMLHKFNVIKDKKDLVLFSFFTSLSLGILSFSKTMYILLKDMDNREFSKESKTTQASYVMNIVSFVYLMLITLYHMYALNCQWDGGDMQSMDDTFYGKKSDKKVIIDVSKPNLGIKQDRKNVNESKHKHFGTKSKQKNIFDVSKIGEKKLHLKLKTEYTKERKHEIPSFEPVIRNKRDNWNTKHYKVMNAKIRKYVEGLSNEEIRKITGALIGEEWVYRNSLILDMKLNRKKFERLWINQQL